MIAAPHGCAAPVSLARQAPGRPIAPVGGSARGRDQRHIVARARKRAGMVLPPVLRKYAGFQDGSEVDSTAEEQSAGSSEERPKRE